MSAESRWAAVAALGQSVWYDNVARPALADGHLARLVEHDRVTGGTSNPTIFSKAVLDSDLYDDELGAAPASDSDAEVFERCWIEDIQRACDLVRPVWERTGGRDGYISIEEEADLAFEVEPAVARAHELRALVDRPNVMVKVPGTEAGVEAFRRLTREGQNINMTLLFSRERYRQIAEGYVAALRSASTPARTSARSRRSRASSSRGSTSRPTSGCPRTRRCAGASPSPTPSSPTPTCSSRPLRPGVGAARGRRRDPQRPLWASTGGKNPAYSPTLYIDGLIGEHTVTTVPDATLDAFRDAGDPRPTASPSSTASTAARADLAALAEAGVDLDEITSRARARRGRAVRGRLREMLEAIGRKRERIAVR